MQYREILDQLRTHVSNLFQSHQDKRFIYHNLDHTEQVVENAVRIANHYQLSDQDFFIVVAACWFHDIGYFYDCTQHEVKGIGLASGFLEGKGFQQDVIDQVAGCIRATMMPQRPYGLLEQIVCDADLFHLGSDSFKERNKLMRKEAEAFFDKKIDKVDWSVKTITLFKAHHFHTDFAQDLLNAKKAANLAEMESKLITQTKVEEAGTPGVMVSKEERRKKVTINRAGASKRCLESRLPITSD